MTLFQNKYRAESHRLAGYDYSSNGMYFVTICTKNRDHYFGEILNGQLIPTKIGQIAMKYWMEIPKHYPFVSIESFVLMPDHLHGVLAFYRPNKTDWTPNKFGSQSQNLGAVIRGFKSTLKRFANQNNIPFEWQRNYHDRIVRSVQELNRISNYMEVNPEEWEGFIKRI